jgi:DNA-binding transcriptional LysR family regulator
MNRSNFDWSLARAFLAAIEHGSLSGAARAIGTTQPTLGRHIADLEAQLGVVLFERTGRGLQPTARALELAEAARSMETGASQLWRLAQATGTHLEGAVRVSASQPVACVLLPPLLARLRQSHPGLHIELVVNNAVSNLLRREADIALRMVRPDQSTLVTRRIGEVTLSVCAHRDHWQRAGRPTTPDDLIAHDLVTGDGNDEVERGLVGWGFAREAIRFALRTDDLMAQWAAVRAGLGVGFIPDYVIRTDPQIERVLPQLPLPRFPIWLTVHREIRTNARIRAVYDFLGEAVKGALASRAQT